MGRGLTSRPASKGRLERCSGWGVFSNQRWEIHQVVGEGDTVVVHTTHHGRQTGNLMGIPPTGRDVAYAYIHIVRFEDGKIVEHWGVRDETTLMRQLRVIPDGAPAAAGAR